ncbi:DUF1642 domain-containing protein [Lacticaseibacillus paracasei]|uniref:DUF1642 domain-containing protein n=1 Tax=Lacticaseibacillus paracasei TaxID=1597 RepID=UPI000BC31319|nr:DUF1642 domain-containing protein [Lacticaseibacillus paracasei]ATG98003.1 hypothetical protein FAM18149p_00650 [Lacticaseibacillus paracasei]RND76033.1 hypothetical protein FAM18149_02363 [Lacticaseibacillus paracasei]RND81865.1 hypothetical protein FAM18168_02195 [Lacticaseibacillus paracasei]
MSEEKLYAVKNDEGRYWDFLNEDGFHDFDSVDTHTTYEKQQAEAVADDCGEHVVTLIEEPKKVVLTKEQAEIVEKAHDSGYPATEIFSGTDSGAGEERLLIKAYVNGYTVAKEKRYMVELDGLVTTDGAKQYLTKKDGKWFACRRMPGMHQDFTDEELNKAPEWAQQLDRKEVTDDDE